MDHWLLSARATCRFGARRNASGMLLAPERRISSALITYIDAAASDRRSAWRETDVISILPSCSSERSANDDAACNSAAHTSPNEESAPHSNRASACRDFSHR